MPEKRNTDGGGPKERRAGWNDGLIARRTPPGDASGGAVGRHEEPDRRSGSVEGHVQGKAKGSRGRAGRSGKGGETGREAGEERGEKERGGEKGREAAAEPPPAPPRFFGSVVREPETLQDRLLRTRLGSLRELVGLSRTRLDGEALAEAGQVLDEAAARDRLPRTYTTVAIAGATGSGKSTLFNALAGARLSETGVRRPTTATTVSCTWDAGPGRGPEGLLERLGIAGRSRRRAHVVDAALRGLILLDLPDYDSIAEGHQEQVDRMLSLVDAVVWVVDPEKYADAVLHERYLRAFAGHAEVSFVVLNQADRLPGEAVHAVLDDLRRLLDERGLALGEHGEPGAAVLAVSALTGDGVAELRQTVGRLVASRSAAARRLAADVDGATRRLRSVCITDENHAPDGLTQQVREEFEDRLATAVGAQAVGQAAERAWLRRADRACGTPWTQLLRRLTALQAERRGEPPALVAKRLRQSEPPRVSRTVVDQAVRQLADEASRGLPQPWAKAVREAAWRGAGKLPRALEEALGQERSAGAEAGGGRKGEGPGGRETEGAGGTRGKGEKKGARETKAGSGGKGEGGTGSRLPRPGWWTAAAAGQAVLLAAQLLGLSWLVSAFLGYSAAGRWLPVGLLVSGSVAGPLLAWGCRIAARGPARSWGRQEEWRMRRRAAEQGHSAVLEPLAAELMRYQEVREQYVTAASPVGGKGLPTTLA